MRDFDKASLAATAALGLLLAACYDREARVRAGEAPTPSADAGASGAGGPPGEPTSMGGAAGTPAASDAGSGGNAAGAGAEPTAPTYPGYTLVIDEHFDVPLDLNSDPIWTWSDGGWATEVRFVEDAISFGGGTMTITTSRGTAPANHSFAENTELPTRALVSGELRTKFNNFRYGRYEARIRTLRPGVAPSGHMLLSSLVLSRTPKLEQWREISLDVTFDGPFGVIAALIYGDGQTFADTMKTSRGVGLESGGDIAMFHDYTLVWSAGSVRWFIDDVLVHSYEAPVTTGPQAPPIPDASTKIMLNAWVSINPFAAGGPGSDWFPFTTEYDYVRFYKEDGEQYPCGPTPSCLPAEDLNLSKNNPKETDTQG